ncbi:MAG: hypothetical protein IOD12_08180 [Silvanigrellales bacterium]|nr:hypothetical protein [Silvanigrellales bacterium]
MEIFFIAVRSFLMVIATLLALLYVLGNMWQKVPSERLKFKTLDYVLYGVVASLFAFGLNSYWGLLAVVPMLLAKLVLHAVIEKKRLRGKGSWIEVHWQKMTPRGFQLPREAMSQIQRLPGDQHFILPRFAGLWAVSYFQNAFRKNTAKMPVTMKAGHEADALAAIEKMIANVKRLESGRTENINLPFGVLKITRL